MGEIHELFVLALSLVWFAGATPESSVFCRTVNQIPATSWVKLVKAGDIIGLTLADRSC